MKKMLLILDLDETLIHATENKLDKPENFRCEQYYVYVRPHLDDFLEIIKNHFEIAVWTSSTEMYAEIVVKNIFPNDYPLSFLWAREKCTKRFDELTYSHVNIKDLKKVKKKGYNLEKILIVDDTPEKISRNYGNHVRIEPFEGDLRDQELSLLSKYLISIKDVPNVRAIEKRGWKKLITSL